jgi:hypothetical protein
MKGTPELLTLLREQIRIVRSDRGIGTVQRARVIGTLIDSALRVVQVGILQERIEALERILKDRKEKTGP